MENKETIVQRVIRTRILYILAFVIFISDQATKYWIEKILPLGTYTLPTKDYPFVPSEPITVISDFFYIVHIGNTGAAFGMFSNYSFVLGLLAFVALIAIYLFRKTLALHTLLMQWIFGLIIGGILGNVLDRLLRGHVVDFLDVHLPFYGRWPAFNVADSAICVGTVMYVITGFFIQEPAKLEPKAGVTES